MMPSQSPHTVTTPALQNVQDLANRHNQQMCGPSGNNEHPPAMAHVSKPAGERDSCQEGSSVASTIQGQNSTPSSLPNNSLVADITEFVTSTPSAIQQWSMNASTAMPGTPAL
jgi:hypothetical protein